MMPGSARIVGLFAKWPAAGAVKTRLASDPERAARIARAFLLDSLDRIAGIEAQRALVFAPLEARADFARLAGDRFSLRPQGEGDLGQRLERFLRESLDRGGELVVVVGADSPTLPPEYIHRAFSLLDEADVVLGPAWDGGFYLLGCRHRVPPIFDGISWGTERVLAQTVAALAGPEWRLALLPPWYDLDTPADWSMLCGHIAAMRRAGTDPGVPRIEALCAEFGP